MGKSTRAALAGKRDIGRHWTTSSRNRGTRVTLDVVIDSSADRDLGLTLARRHVRLV
jgi:hypothetical protein